jgi:4-hydroxybenzoate polyprenyltransferase
MAYQTALLFQLQLPFALYLFVFSGSVCSYNFHWYLAPPGFTEKSSKQKWSLSNKKIHLVLFVIGLTGAGVSAFLLLEHWFWLGVTAFLTFLYSAPLIEHPFTIWLRRIAIGKTIYLAIAWMHVTTLLPLVMESGIISTPHIFFVLNRFFFIYAICIVFDRRDAKSDRKAGIKSLITYLSPKGVDRLFWFTLLLVLATTYGLLNTFTTADTIILLLPALIMGLLYNYSKRNTSDYLYYFLLDGLMALSAPILILAKFAR